VLGSYADCRWIESTRVRNFLFFKICKYVTDLDRLCGLVVRVSGYRSRGPGSDSRRFQIFWEAVVWNGVHSASWGQLRSYLGEIVAAPVKKTETTTGGIRCADHATPSIRKSWHYFANKRRSLGRHSSLADQSHVVLFFMLWIYCRINRPNSRQNSRPVRICTL
jgi:hypothetical protein